MPPYAWSVMDHEEDIPTKQPAPQEKARIPGSNANQKWAQSTENSAKEGAKTPGGLREFKLPRSARLLRRTEYQRVYRDGSRVGARHFVFFWLTNKVGGNRLGITATRKIGSAVIRAKCKRRTRELYRLNRTMLRDINVDVVVNVKRSCKDASWDALQSDFLHGLEKLQSVEQQRGVGSEGQLRG